MSSTEEFVVIDDDDDDRTIHYLTIENGSIIDEFPSHVECGDLIELKIIDSIYYDLIQVYFDGEEFRCLINGIHLKDLHQSNSKESRRIDLSILMDFPSIDLQFGLFPSNEREKISQMNFIPKEFCEKNLWQIHQNLVKISLNDQRESQKINLRRGEKVQINWNSKRGIPYRIEEKRFCPISGGLYTVDKSLSSINGKFEKIYQHFGISYLFRLTETNQIQDILVCVVKNKFRTKLLRIDDQFIQSTKIFIEENDSILLQWNTKDKLSFYQIQPFRIDSSTNQPIQLKRDGIDFFWPNHPTTIGSYQFKFIHEGIYYIRTTTNLIVTIVVQPNIQIHRFPVFADQLILKMKRNDFIEFQWKTCESPSNPVLLTIDANTSVIPDRHQGLQRLFQCSEHRCVKVENYFRQYFHTLETFLFSIDECGLFNFSYSDNQDDVLLSVIVENTSQNHHVMIDEENHFDRSMILIRRNDRIFFDCSSNQCENLCRIDEFGQLTNPNEIYFRFDKNFREDFYYRFDQIGIFYYSINFDLQMKKSLERKSILSIIVLPEIRFHWKLIRSSDFDSQAIQTNLNDFIIWQFEQVIRADLIPLRSNETLDELISSHDRVSLSRNRQCIAVECIVNGTFFFANPEFERVTGSEENRLISTIIIDPPFYRSSILIDQNQFYPEVLFVRQNETVSWILSDQNDKHQINVLPKGKENQSIERKILIEESLEEYLSDIYYLYRFDELGEFIIRSNRFDHQLRIVVCSNDRKESEKPLLVDDIDTSTPFGTNLHFQSNSTQREIYFTIDGSTPTRPDHQIQIYDPDKGISLRQSGLHLIRAFAVEQEKIPSEIFTSSPTFVMESEESQLEQEQRSIWKYSQVILCASIQYPNKLYGKIDVEPSNLIDLIDYFELFVDDVAQKVHLSSKDLKFSAEGFAGGEQYEIYVLAYPIDHLNDLKPIRSNKRAFEIKREIQSGAPLISLAVSNDQQTIFVMWAHIGQHVEEYLVFVDQILTKNIVEKDFNDYFGIQFHGAKQRKKYLIHVEAKLKDQSENLRSNVIAVNPPLEMSLKEQLVDRYFAYITVNAEAPPPDMRLEVIDLEQFAQRRPEPNRNFQSVSINEGLRQAIPTIEFERDRKGIKLFWKKKDPIFDQFIEHYQIYLDGKSVGDPIIPSNEEQIPLKLSPGDHQCYLMLIPKEDQTDIYQSNILTIHIPTDEEEENNLIRERNIPTAHLNVQMIEQRKMRLSWSFNHPIPQGISLVQYQIHLIGEYFPSNFTSHQQIIKSSTEIEHLWRVNQSPLEIIDICSNHQYKLFVRSIFHIEGLNDPKHLSTTSNEVTTDKFGRLIDLLIAPQLFVDHLSLKSVYLKWTNDSSMNPSIISGYRLYLNKNVKKTFSRDENQFKVEELKSGSENDLELSISCDEDYCQEKYSSSIRIICPSRPPIIPIESIQTLYPYTIKIQWQIDQSICLTSIDSFHLYLDGKFYDEIIREDKRIYEYLFKDLQSDRIYSISMKSFIQEKQIDSSTYRCSNQSKSSNILNLKCFLPPQGPSMKICQMSPKQLLIQWNQIKTNENKFIQGYQIFRNGRSMTNLIPNDQQQLSIDDLQIGENYSFEILPIINSTNLFPIGDQYNPIKYSDYCPGPRLDLRFDDFIEIPSKIWFESITGRSAFVCWSTIDTTKSHQCQPEFFQLYLWMTDEQREDQANILRISKDKTSELLKDLLPNTKYSLRFESIQHRHEPKSNDVFLVSTKSELIEFRTGSPPTAPNQLKIIALTSTAIRIQFDPFVEHGVEILSLRVLCQSSINDNDNDDDDDDDDDDQINEKMKTKKDIRMDLTSDTTELILSNLESSTNYCLIISAITDEYLKDIQCNDIRNLGKTRLKPSYWLSESKLFFTTSGYEPADQIRIRQSTIESIDFEWNLAKVYGSTKYLGQKLRWKFDDSSDEHSIDLDDQCHQTSIKGILSTGKYFISIDSFFQIKINLQPDDDSNSFKQICVTRSKMTSIHLPRPSLPERPLIYLTGYSSSTIDLTWNKPSMFHLIDHPQRLNEQIPIHRKLIHYRIDINGEQYQTLESNQYQCTLTECLPNHYYQIQLITETIIQKDYLPEHMKNEFDLSDQPDQTSSKKLKIRTLKDEDLLRSFQCFFEFHHNVTKENIRQERNEVKPLGKINVQWTIKDSTQIQHFILRWFSSKNSQIHEKIFSNSQTSFTIDSLDEKYFYQIELIIVDFNGHRHEYEPLKMPIPGEPDAPKLWLVKKSDRSFVVEWSEPKSYGIPLIGFQLFIEGKKAGEMISLNLHRAEIPSRSNRTYDINICALTDHPDRSSSMLSQTLAVITTPHENPLQTIFNEETIIPLHIEQIDQNQLLINWNTFQPIKPIRAFYLQYLCLNNQKNETLKLSKRHQQTILKDLRSGFTYEITLMAVDHNGEILYNSSKRTIQMSSPPNAPIVAIRERRSDHVTIEWRPSPSSGQLTIVGYKIFVNNRLTGILSHDQLSYTLTNGNPCEEYLIHIQALSNDPHVTSPLSREVKFIWPGIKPGEFLRLDDGSTNTIILAWNHPQLEDQDDQIIRYKLFSENLSTRFIRSHGEYSSDIHQAAIYDLTNGQYRIWLEIQSEQHSIRTSSIFVTLGKYLNRNRKYFDAAKCFMKKQKKFRPTPPTTTMSIDPLMNNFARHIQFS